jgi:hypothetical protein
LALDSLSILPSDIIFWAFIGCAIPILSTAFLVICVGAIPVAAQDIRGIPSKLEVGWAFEHGACALLV